MTNMNVEVKENMMNANLDVESMMNVNLNVKRSMMNAN